MTTLQITYQLETSKHNSQLSHPHSTTVLVLIYFLPVLFRVLMYFFKVITSF